MSEGIIIKADGNKTLAQMQAEVAAFEANPVDPGAAVSTPPPADAVAPVTPDGKAALPEPGQTPPAAEQAKPDQQPKEATEKAATETPKAAEPVKEKDWKAAYEGLQRSYNKKFLEEKAQPKQGETPKTVAPSLEENLDNVTPEFRNQIIADLDKDLVGTLIKLNRAIARNEVMPVRSKLEAADFEKQEVAKLAGLDRLANEGHEWLKTEDGLRKMEAALNENPELWKSKDPYRAALGFIPDLPSKAGQRGQAQAMGLTPILGAGTALPPVVSAPAVSKMAKLESLSGEVAQAQSRGQWDKAKELLKQMGEIERGY